MQQGASVHRLKCLVDACNTTGVSAHPTQYWHHYRSYHVAGAFALLVLACHGTVPSCVLHTRSRALVQGSLPFPIAGYPTTVDSPPPPAVGAGG